MPTKRLSLADRIALAHKEKTSPEVLKEERRLINSLTNSQDKTDSNPASDQGPVSGIHSISGQETDSNQLGYSQNPDNNQLLSGQGPEPNTQSVSDHDPVSGIRHTVSRHGPVSSQDPVSSKNPVMVHGPVSNQDPVSSIRSESSIQGQKIILAPLQQVVYLWFKNNEDKGFFNKGIIHRETGVAIPTIKKIVSKLSSLKILNIGQYSPVSRRQEYSLNNNIHIEIQSPNINQLVSSREPVSSTPIGSSIQPGYSHGSVHSQYPVKVHGPVSSQYPVSNQGIMDTKNISYKIVDSFIKLSNYLNNDYWQKTGISIKKFKEWEKKEELDESHTEDFLITQLNWVRYKDEVEKSINKSVVGFFHTSVILAGGIERPKGYLSPTEKRIKIMQKEIEARETAKNELERLEKKRAELELDDKYQELISHPAELGEVVSQIKASDDLNVRVKQDLEKFKKTGDIGLSLKFEIQKIIKG